MEGYVHLYSKERDCIFFEKDVINNHDDANFIKNTLLASQFGFPWRESELYLPCVDAEDDVLLLWKMFLHTGQIHQINNHTAIRAIQFCNKYFCFKFLEQVVTFAKNKSTQIPCYPEDDLCNAYEWRIWCIPQFVENTIIETPNSWIVRGPTSGGGQWLARLK